MPFRRLRQFGFMAKSVPKSLHCPKTLGSAHFLNISGAHEVTIPRNLASSTGGGIWLQGEKPADPSRRAEVDSGEIVLIGQLSHNLGRSRASPKMPQPAPRLAVRQECRTSLGHLISLVYGEGRRSPQTAKEGRHSCRPATSAPTSRATGVSHLLEALDFVGVWRRSIGFGLAVCRTYPARLRKSGIRPEFPLVFVICVHTNSSNS